MSANNVLQPSPSAPALSRMTGLIRLFMRQRLLQIEPNLGLVRFYYYWTDSDTDTDTLIKIFTSAVISLICVDISLPLDHPIRAAMEQAKQLGVPPPQAIHHELRTAENSAVHVLAKLQSMKESNPHLTLLDVGAGSGTISVTFAKAIPDGRITAVDLNPDILPRARAVAEMAGVKNIEFQQGDAYKLPFADATFDIAFCHQMLTHLKAPWDALREMLRVTKPAGIVAAREGDLETECFWPELSGLSKFHKLAAGMMSAAGGTPTGGRQLLPWALKAGVERDQITLSYSAWSYNTPSDKKTWAQAMAERVRGGRLREAGLKSGLATEDDLEEMAKA